MAKPVDLVWCFGFLPLDKIHLTKDCFCWICKKTPLELHLNRDFESVGVL